MLYMEHEKDGHLEIGEVEMTFMEQIKYIEEMEKLHETFAKVGESSKSLGKAIKDATAWVEFLSNREVSISPYEENEKRVIGGKIVNVTYHAIDWKKVFSAKN